MQKLAILGASLLLFGASAASATNPEVSASAQSTIDRGFLTTTSSQFILRVDLRSGQAMLTRPADPVAGKGFSFNIGKDFGALANLDFMLLGTTSGTNSDGQPVIRAICSAQATNVTTAATLVSNTCTATPSAACTSAMSAFTDAVAAFGDCIRNYTAEK